MIIISIAKIKEIPKDLDCDLQAFIHKSTGETLIMPDPNKIEDYGLEAWENEIETLKNNAKDYFEIKQWTSDDGYDVMRLFANEVSNAKIREELVEALEKNKPFRQFMLVLDHYGSIRDNWFEFKKKWQQDFVSNQLKDLFQIEPWNDICNITLFTSLN